jgi:YgiT-type zinc finger domain-containing protein
MCKGSLEDKNTTFMVDLENCIVIVKNVPSQVCIQCGEVSYGNDVAKRLEYIVNNFRDEYAEIAVLHYSDRVA